MNLRTPGALLLALTSLCCAALPARAAGPVSASDLSAYTDKLLSSVYPAGQPGAAVLVQKDGQVVLRKGNGMANLELGVPVTPENVFEIGSITKQFTAAAILLLQERGKLRVEDPITKYLPDYPTQGRTITIENLLTHTSGIPSYTGLPEWYPHIREDLKPADVAALFRDKPLEFNPGERWAYDNSGFFLLGMIVEKASGKTYEQFVEEEIFRKLGMAHSRYGHSEEIVPLRAAGYSRDGEGYRNTAFISMTQPYAAGALMSTVDDLALWGRALRSEALLKRASLDRMLTVHRLPSGVSTQYGYGIGVLDLWGTRVIQHGGDINGYTANVTWAPDERLFVAILSNNDASDPRPDDLALRIVAKAIGKPVEERKTLELDARTLDEYTGVYRFESNVTRSILREGTRLFAQRNGRRQEISAAAPDEFVYADGASTLHFRRDAQGKVTGVDFRSTLGPPATGTRTDEPPPQERRAVQVDPGVFDAYAGEYELRPGFSIAISREGDRIFAQPTGQPRLELFPESETRFFLKDVDAQIEFVRGADGKVTGLVLHQNGRDLPGRRK
ncbi:MAG TPA: serine hydrolase [Thermoanaerobaculia bacterium]|nr:serine hydrolase [Thermoanaerobaculia bacterium]